MPEDSYAIFMFAFEQDLHAAHDLFGIGFVVSCSHNSYGPNQNMFNKYRSVIGIFFNQLHCEKPLPILGDGEQTRTFPHIDDISPRLPLGQQFQVSRTRSTGLELRSNAQSVIQPQRSAAFMEKPDHPIMHLVGCMEVVNAVSNHAKLKAYFKLQSPLGWKKDGIS